LVRRGEYLRALDGVLVDPCLVAGTGVVDVSHTIVGVRSKGEIKTTLNTYSHVILSLRGEVASAMEDELGEKEDPPSR
jgi:hypothetical protein